ncbi:response regulator transcription factor [Actinoplanes sp. NPDC049681]|uniref:response regulator transcription factor n=1 Tax=Actinoplanes sp. NPDC049681 TaxID=3363905 RepID=UPI0037B36284
MPDIDSLCLCRTIRTAGDTTVIGLAAGGEAGRVRGLQAGADDCINKPYGARELVARMGAAGCLRSSVEAACGSSPRSVRCRFPNRPSR